MSVPLIFDGDGLHARSHFMAERVAPETNENAMIVGIQLAVKSVISILSPNSGKLFDTPTHLLFCWDGSVAKRDKQRGPKTPEYLEGKQLLAEVLAECFGAANAFPAGEADDAVATAARRMEALESNTAVYIASGDKDLQQLVTERVYYYSLNEKSIFNWSAICTKWRIKHPSQVAIALAIAGDSSDLISGVKGWGMKKVEKIFSEVSDDMPIEEVYALVKSKMNPEQAAQFDESLDLTLLRTDVEAIPDPSPIVFGGKDLLEGLGWNLWPQIESLQMATQYD